jgi:hypothetical protein
VPRGVEGDGSHAVASDDWFIDFARRNRVLSSIFPVLQFSVVCGGVAAFECDRRWYGEIWLFWLSQLVCDGASPGTVAVRVEAGVNFVFIEGLEALVEANYAFTIAFVLGECSDDLDL